MAVNDVYKVALVGRVAQDDIVITHHYRMTAFGSSEATSQQELIDEWVTNCQGLWLGLSYGDYVMDYIGVKNVTQNMDELTQEIDLNGTQSGEGMPNFVSPVVSLRTGFAGRSNRGRNYLPPPSEGNCQGNNIVLAMATAIRDYYNAAIALGPGATGATFGMTVYSRVLSSDKMVTNFLVRTPLGTQRRRRIGVGS